MFEGEALQIYTCADRANITAEHALASEIIKHKYMLMCNHKIHINIMLCLLNSDVVDPCFQTQRAIGQRLYRQSLMMFTSEVYLLITISHNH